MSVNPEVYKRLSDIDHVLQRYGMYIGNKGSSGREAKCLDPQTLKITVGKVKHSEGAEHIFLEVLGNVCDNMQRTKEYNMANPTQKVDLGVVEVSMNEQWVVVKNYGLAVPVAMNPQENMWIPHMIFGTMRSSSNYDDTKDRQTIGMNGLGAKAANIFSRQFIVECADPQRRLLYKQMWTNNMKTVSQPAMTEYNGPGYVQVSYNLDFARFYMQGYDVEAQAIYMAHCAIASMTSSVPVIFNGIKIHIPTLTDYAKLFFDVQKENSITFTDPDKVYDVCLVDTPDKGTVVSFVNGVLVRGGGVHVDEIFTEIVTAVRDFFGKMLEGIQLNKRDIIGHISLFISARVINPQFNSQTKEYLSGLLPIVLDGKEVQRKLPSAALPDRLIKQMSKWKLIERLHEDIEMKQLNKLKKTDGKKKGKPRITKLQDAGYASDPSKRHLATLFVCEGDSASQYPEEFISHYPNNSGRDLCGILPLHGKMLNALNANFLQIVNNKDFSNLKETLGLEENMDYSLQQNRARLRYGQIVVMPDADVDGKHILGLFLLYFLTRFPTLVQSGYIKFLRTPVVSVHKRGVTHKFYTLESYARWESANPDFMSWKHEYYKGLGSSDPVTIAQDFEDPRIVRFHIDVNTRESMELAFRKIEADKRKEWLTHFFNAQIPDVETYTEMPISIFINFELVTFSIESIIRSIPEAYDGLKDSQRKAFYSGLKKIKENSSMKVAQLASAAAELTCYKHGEGSLADAIVLMTQNYVGSNNMPYFEAKGLFGTRKKNGADAANPRYTHVKINWWVPYVFRKEDRPIEKFIIDEGEERETESLFPILPMHVVNGVVGIGTGYSTNIPSHNPMDVAFWLQCRLAKNLQPDKNVPTPMLKPWVRGWNGRVEIKKNGFISHGTFEISEHKKKKVVTITELPIGCWTKKYEDFINGLEDAGTIDSVQHSSIKDSVKMVITGWNSGEVTEKKLKLSRVHSYKNMTVIYRNAQRKIRPVIYSDINSLMEDYFTIRLDKYRERKSYILQNIQNEVAKMTQRAQFITLVNEGHILILKRPQGEILQKLAQYQLPEELFKEVRAHEFSEERVAELMKKIEEKRQEYQNMYNMTAEQLWYQDLEEFIQKYCTHEKVKRSTYETTGLHYIPTDEIDESELKAAQKEMEDEVRAKETQKEEAAAVDE